MTFGLWEDLGFNVPFACLERLHILAFSAALQCRRRPSRCVYVSQISFTEGDGAYERYPSEVNVPWNFYEGCQPFLPENTKPSRVVLKTLVFLHQVCAWCADDSCPSWFPKYVVVERVAMTITHRLYLLTILYVCRFCSIRSNSETLDGKIRPI